MIELRPAMVGVFLSILMLGCGTADTPPDTPEAAPAASVIEGPSRAQQAAVANPDRPDRDRARDVDRKPAEVLAFLGIEPGMRVAEMMAGEGYYTEILAGAVSPGGMLYAHNSPFVLERFAESPFSDRLARIDAEHVVRIDSEPEEPGLPEDLDAVILFRFYHDFCWQGVDRAAFNRAVFESLRPGGVLGVIDHHAEPGSGERDAESLHRIDAELVRREIEAAGFVFEAESDLLSDPTDSRDWFIFDPERPGRDRTDRFLLRFRKP